MGIFISSQYLLLDNEFSHFLFLTDYMTVAETVGIVAIQHVLDHMDCKQPHYVFIILDEDSWCIITTTLCERMIIGNCITATVKPDYYISSATKVLQEHLKAASSCFANTENLYEQVLIRK